MNRLKIFLRARWEELLIWGLAVNLTAWALTTGSLILVLITIASVGLAIFLVYVLIERAGIRQARKVIGENTAFKIARKGILFTVGKQTDTIAFAIENQKPDHIGLICSHISEPFADELISRFNYIPEETARKRIVDPFEIREIHQVTNLLMDWMSKMGITTGQMVVDVTGGMTTMSVGVFSTAEDRRVDSQYIRSQYDEQNHVIKDTMEGVFVTHYPDTPR